jgi:indolepyruvate ferredoxin oxidoreductase alpha subunit
VISDLCKKFSIPVGEIPSTVPLEKLVTGLGLSIRRPTLCSGCPHRASFYAIKKAFPNGIFPSDIGCYTLGMNLESVDTCHDMGGAITFASGLYQAYHQDGHEVPIIATIGDSTFYHSGAPGLLNAVYNGAKFVLVILDNSIVAMTGMQPTPESGVTADGHAGKSLSLEDLVKGCGVKYLRVINPYDIEGMVQELEKAHKYTQQRDGGMAVLIARYPCIIFQKEQLKVNPIKVEIRHTPPQEKDLPQVKSGEMDKSLLPVLDEEACVQCDTCIIQCPEGAISKTENGYPLIDYSKCTGCRTCARECLTSAMNMPPVGACIGCGYCLKRFECPSLIRGEDGRVKIDRLTCVDCGLCMQICGQEAIVQVSGTQ